MNHQSQFSYWSELLVSITLAAMVLMPFHILDIMALLPSHCFIALSPEAFRAQSQQSFHTLALP